MELKDTLRQMNIYVNFQTNQGLVSLIFDCSESQYDYISVQLQKRFENATLTKITVLPEWAKMFLLRNGNSGGEYSR